DLLIGFVSDSYSTNYLIDLHAGIILDVEATPAHRTAEVESTKTMINRVEERFVLKPRRLAGDTAYGTASMLGWMVEEKEIAPHVPVWDKTRRDDGTFQRGSFHWDEQANEYRCPGGHALRSDWRAYTNPRTHITKADTVIYRSSQHNCSGCAMKEQCCPNISFRKIARSIHESARDVARKLSATPEFKQSRRERKKVEMLFAHLKRILKLDRLRLRGLSGAQDEFLLAATAQNLRRMAKRLAPLGEGITAVAA
ncbi:transposase, partial [Ralstonia pseudosolanacearum]